MDRVLSDAALGTIIQVCVAALICVGAWAVFARKRVGPLTWLGLMSAPAGLVGLAFAAGALTAVALLQIPGFPDAASAPGTVVHQVAGGRADLAALMALATVALVKTAFAEELVFRGLIAKRLYKRLGLWGGNVAQASVFAAIHLPVLVLPEARNLIGAGMIGFAFLIALVAGWLNERRANGSIWPGVGLHAGANLTTYLMLALT